MEITSPVSIEPDSTRSDATSMPVPSIMGGWLSPMPRIPRHQPWVARQLAPEWQALREAPAGLPSSGPSHRPRSAARRTRDQGPARRQSHDETHSDSLRCRVSRRPRPIARSQSRALQRRFPIAPDRSPASNERSGRGSKPTRPECALVLRLDLVNERAGARRDPANE